MGQQADTMTAEPEGVGECELQQLESRAMADGCKGVRELEGRVQS